MFRMEKNGCTTLPEKIMMGIKKCIILWRSKKVNIA